MATSWLFSPTSSSDNDAIQSQDQDNDESNSNPSLNVEADSTTSTATTSTQPAQSPTQASQVKGLENFGSTCFFNASVQALLSCPTFVDYLQILCAAHQRNLSHSSFTPHQPIHQKQKQNKSKIFCELLLEIYKGSIVSPKQLFAQLCNFHPSEFSSFTQSDAHESFNKMMEMLEIEQSYIQSESRSDAVIDDMFAFLDADDDDDKQNKQESAIASEQAARNPFHGLLESTLQCNKCGYLGERRQTSFRCLTLSLADSSRSTSHNGANESSHVVATTGSRRDVRLMDRLAAFGSEERIQGYRCVMCECRGVSQQISLRLREDEGAHLGDTELRVLRAQQQRLMEKLHTHSFADMDHSAVPQTQQHRYPTMIDTTLTTKQRNKYEIDVSRSVDYRTQAGKKQFVSRYPDVLCIHLNRLQFGAKDNRFVAFKPFLTLSKDAGAHSSLYGQAHDDDVCEYEVCWQYLLMAVVVHYGDGSGGHYTTYKRNMDVVNINNQDSDSGESRKLEWKSLHELKRIEQYSTWYDISDEFVKKVEMHEVLMSKAYMLFYQKNQYSI